MNPLSRLIVVLLVAAAATAGVIVLVTPGPAGADVTARVSGSANRTEALRSAISAESARIRGSAPALAAARRRLARLRAVAARQQAELRGVERALVAARDRLTVLIARQRGATNALRKNLITAYATPDPDIVSVILTARGFADLLEKADFLKRIAQQNARIMDTARTSKVAVAEQTNKLAKTQVRQRKLAGELEHRRATTRRWPCRLRCTRAAAAAGVARQQVSAAAHDPTAARCAAQEARAHGTQQHRDQPGWSSAGPAGAPQAVQLVIAAGNAIAGLPYLLGTCSWSSPVGALTPPPCAAAGRAGHAQCDRPPDSWLATRLACSAGEGGLRRSMSVSWLTRRTSSNQDAFRDRRDRDRSAVQLGPWGTA